MYGVSTLDFGAGHKQIVSRSESARRGVGTLQDNETSYDRLNEEIQRFISMLARALDPTFVAQSFSITGTSDPTPDELVGTLSTLSSPIDLVSGHLDRLMSLWSLTQTTSWREEGGVEISEEVWSYAGAALAASEFWTCPSPFASVSEDGYVHITWSNDGGDRVVLEVGSEDWWLSYIGLTRSGDEVHEIAIGNLKGIQQFLGKWL